MKYINKYIRKYNESSKQSFDKGDIELFFAHTFDLCESYNIDDEIFFDPSNNDWANNDFSNDSGQCNKGFSISLHHDFYDTVEDVKDFKKYLQILNELESDLDRFIETYNPKYLEFCLNTDSIMMIVIRP
jgi:hypothetical protein